MYIARKRSMYLLKQKTKLTAVLLFLFIPSKTDYYIVNDCPINAGFVNVNLLLIGESVTSQFILTRDIGTGECFHYKSFG